MYEYIHCFNMSFFNKNVLEVLKVMKKMQNLHKTN